MGATATPSPGSTYQMTQTDSNNLALLVQGLGGNSSGGPSQVYLGTANQIYGPQGFESGQAYTGGPQMLRDQSGRPITQPNQQPNQQPVWSTIEQAKAAFGNFSAKQVNDWVAQGVLAGQLSPGSGWLQGQDLWDKMVDVAARQGANGNAVSPFDILKTYITNQSTAGVWAKDKGGMFETNSLTGQRRYIGPEFRTFNTTQVNLTDPTQAKAVSTAVFQQMLGRDPLPGELAQYADALRAAEQANPTTISTTNQYDDLGNVIATTKQDQKGGFNLDAQKYLAEQQAKSNPEYGATQAATTYENAFESAVFGPAR